MIFSTDLCPICGQKLTKKKIYSSNPANDMNSFTCPTTESMKDDDGMDFTSPHYEYKQRSINPFCIMSLPPFELIHYETDKVTEVWRAGFLYLSSFIFKMPLLDVDYSQPHDVVARLKLLVTFS